MASDTRVSARSILVRMTCLVRSYTYSLHLMRILGNAVSGYIGWVSGTNITGRIVWLSTRPSMPFSTKISDWLRPG